MSKVSTGLVVSFMVAGIASTLGCVVPNAQAGQSAYLGSTEMADSRQDTVFACVSRSDGTRLVRARHRPGTDELVVDGPGFVYRPAPPPHADSLAWFRRRDPIILEGRGFYWNGVPRQIAPEEIKVIGTRDGVSLYAEADTPVGELGTLFVPVHPGCSYQPYYHFSH